MNDDEEQTLGKEHSVWGYLTFDDLKTSSRKWDINKKFNKGELKGLTPLQYAIYRRCRKTAKDMIDNGADVNAKFDNGYTPLLLAIKKKNKLKMIRMLLNKGADIDARTDQGYTALMLASMYRKNLKVLEFFLKREVDLLAKNNAGLTALELAAGNVKVINALLRAIDMPAASLADAIARKLTVGF